MFLDEGGEFVDVVILFIENFLGVGGVDDDVGNGGSDVDFDVGVVFFG